MKTILILEDNILFQKEYEILLGKKLTLLQAYTIQQAEEFVVHHPEIDLMIIDACVPGNEINTKDFVIKIKKFFSGVMIACSSEAEYRKELMEVGCNYESAKYEVHSLVLKLLNNT